MEKAQKTTEKNNSILSSNIRTFYQIAQQSYKEMVIDHDKNRRPKPNGEPGWIVTYDPEQKGFKNAMIAIIFCGICLDALLHLLIVRELGLEKFEGCDYKPYEAKLKLLGYSDQRILDKCPEYRKVRREVVHEKAYMGDSFRIAQHEAEFSINLLEGIIKYFNLNLS